MPHRTCKCSKGLFRSKGVLRPPPRNREHTTSIDPLNPPLHQFNNFVLIGIQQAPAIGRAIAELIYDDDFTTIDLTRFCFDRLINDIKMNEAAIV